MIKLYTSTNKAFMAFMDSFASVVNLIIFDNKAFNESKKSFTMQTKSGESINSGIGWTGLFGALGLGGINSGTKEENNLM